MIAPFYFKKFKDKILITNDVGKYHFLSIDDFKSFINDNIAKGSNLYNSLKDEYFLFDGSAQNFLEKIKPAIREGKGYVF